MKKLCCFLIDIYKAIASPIFGNCCRFKPSCSEYTRQAIEKYGVFKGIKLGFFRILRCNPFCKGGDDPLN